MDTTQYEGEMIFGGNYPCVVHFNPIRRSAFVSTMNFIEKFPNFSSKPLICDLVNLARQAT